MLGRKKTERENLLYVMLNKWIDTLFLYLDLRCDKYSIAYLQQAEHVDVTVKQRGTVKWSSS